MRETAQNLLQLKAPVDSKTKAKWTPLITASHFGSLDCVQLLVNMGADVNASTSKNYTAMHHAAEKGHTDIVDFLMQNGTLLPTLDNKSRTALDIATQSGHEKIIALLGASVHNKTKEERIQSHVTEEMPKKSPAREDPAFDEIIAPVAEQAVESVQNPIIVPERKLDIKHEIEAKPVKISDSGVSAELIDMVSKLSENNNKGFSMLHIVSKYNNKEMAGGFGILMMEIDFKP